MIRLVYVLAITTLVATGFALLVYPKAITLAEKNNDLQQWLSGALEVCSPKPDDVTPLITPNRPSHDGEVRSDGASHSSSFSFVRAPDVGSSS